MTTPDEWLRVRRHLIAQRHGLAVSAADLYPDLPRVAGTPLLADPAWLPPEPVPLTDLGLHLRPDAPPPAITGSEPGARAFLPVGCARYSAAMAELAAPTVFLNRRVYRLVDAAADHFVFGLGGYFDGIDVGEACAHEYAAHQLGLLDGLHLRAAVGDPRDPTRRPTTLAVSTLTLRHDRATGSATCYLHWRDPRRVGHAGGLYQVIPVGVFQPSGDQPWHLRHDFSLWRGMVREFAEELLGHPEDHTGGSAPLDYDGWPFAARLTAELGNGIRVHSLGMGVDPLTFATDLLTVAVVDSALFDELFADRVAVNEEGRVLAGLPFTADTVRRFTHREPTQAAGAALLALAWHHRAALLT